MNTAIMQNNIRIGAQIIIEGEKLEITELVVLFTLFLKLAIPALVVLQVIADFFGLCMGVIDGVNDALSGLPKFDFAPIGKQDFLIIYLGLCLLGILIKVMAKK